MAPPSPHRSTLSRLLICAKGCGGREGWGGRLASYTRTSDGLSAPASSHNSDLSPSPSLFLGRPMEDRGGGVVFQWRCAGQPAFIRMNQRGDKISPVTKQGYEIRVLIEFSSPGWGCGALNIIEFDRLMKRAPVLVLPISTGPGISRPPLLYAYTRMLMFNMYCMFTKPHSKKADFSKHTSMWNIIMRGGLCWFSVSGHLTIC